MRKRGDRDWEYVRVSSQGKRRARFSNNRRAGVRQLVFDGGGSPGWQRERKEMTRWRQLSLKGKGLAFSPAGTSGLWVEIDREGGVRYGEGYLACRSSAARRWRREDDCYAICDPLCINTCHMWWVRDVLTRRSEVLLREVGGDGEEPGAPHLLPLPRLQLQPVLPLVVLMCHMHHRPCEVTT